VVPGRAFFAARAGRRAASLDYLARGRGCEACGGRGTRGRTGIYELFVLDSELADRVAEDAPVYELRERALEKGMKTLLDDALEKARAGVIPISEVLRAVPYRMLEDRSGSPRSA